MIKSYRILRKRGTCMDVKLACGHEINVHVDYPMERLSKRTCWECVETQHELAHRLGRCRCDEGGVPAEPEAPGIMAVLASKAKT
jgi:hypothetical protein